VSTSSFSFVPANVHQDDAEEDEQGTCMWKGPIGIASDARHAACVLVLLTGRKNFWAPGRPSHPVESSNQLLIRSHRWKSCHARVYGRGGSRGAHYYRWQGR
jgi:hypothetical protein